MLWRRTEWPLLPINNSHNHLFVNKARKWTHLPEKCRMAHSPRRKPTQTNSRFQRLQLKSQAISKFWHEGPKLSHLMVSLRKWFVSDFFSCVDIGTVFFSSFFFLFLFFPYIYIFISYIYKSFPLVYNYNLLLFSYFLIIVTSYALLKREKIISYSFRFGTFALIWTFCVPYIDISVHQSLAFPLHALLYNRCFNKPRIRSLSQQNCWKNEQHSVLIDSFFLFLLLLLLLLLLLSQLSKEREIFLD